MSKIGDVPDPIFRLYDRRRMSDLHIQPNGHDRLIIWILAGVFLLWLLQYADFRDDTSDHTDDPQGERP